MPYCWLGALASALLPATCVYVYVVACVAYWLVGGTRVHVVGADVWLGQGHVLGADVWRVHVLGADVWLGEGHVWMWLELTCVYVAGTCVYVVRAPRPESVRDYAGLQLPALLPPTRPTHCRTGLTPHPALCSSREDLHLPFDTGLSCLIPSCFA